MPVHSSYKVIIKQGSYLNKSVGPTVKKRNMFLMSESLITTCGKGRHSPTYKSKSVFILLSR